MKKNFISTILVAVGFIVGASALSVFADWTPAQYTPPTCPSGQPGCDPPLNVSSADQTKLGALFVNANTTNPGTYGLKVWGTSLLYNTLQVGTDSTPGTFYLVNSQKGAGKVLTSDASGKGEWKSPNQFVPEGYFRHALGSASVIYTGSPGVDYLITAYIQLRSSPTAECKLIGTINGAQQLHQYSIPANTSIPVTVLIGQSSGTMAVQLKTPDTNGSVMAQGGFTGNCQIDGGDIVFTPVF